LEFQGQPLEGAEEVARVGVSAGAAGAAAAAEAVYPNSWTASAISRAYRKVGGGIRGVREGIPRQLHGLLHPGLHLSSARGRGGDPWGCAALVFVTLTHHTTIRAGA
jgi:hypothetical protein